MTDTPTSDIAVAIKGLDDELAAQRQRIVPEPYVIGVGAGADPAFAYFPNGAVRRLTGNSELIYLRDERRIRTVTISSTDVERAAKVSKALFDI